MDLAPALTAALAADLVIAGGYALAGALLWRRAAATSAPRIGAMFALWWWGNAATGVASVAFRLLARLEGVPLLVLDVAEQLTLVFFATALVGFTSYVAYIYLGSHRAEWIIVPAYSLLVLWSVANIFVTPATGATTVNGRPHLVRDGAGFGPPLALTATLLVVPLAVAIVAYASLYRSTTAVETRYRIALVTGTLVVWLAGVFVLSIPEAAESVEVQLATRASILASCGLIVLAFRPSLRVRAGLGHAESREHLGRRRRALAERTRDLV